MKSLGVLILLAVSVQSLFAQRSIIELSPLPIAFSGRCYLAVKAAFNDLRRWKEFPMRMKDPKNYDVRIRDTKTNIVLDLIPMKAPGEGLKSGGVTDLGVELRYTIDPKTFKVLKRQRYE